MSVPHYYTAFAPFRALFAQGRPILTYHHVAPPRHGARIKGLYVKPALFRQQLVELKREGFTSPPYDPTAPFSSSRKEVLFTFDDAFLDVFENGLPILKEQGFRAIQFVVYGLIGKTNEWQQEMGDVREPVMDRTQIREWLAAGQDIGSHTLSHPRLSQLEPLRAFEEISASRKALEDAFGVPIRHFCYPYGDWNERLRDQVKEAGYASACTTMPGVNTVETSMFELRRITARYASRNLKNVWQWFSRRMARQNPQ